MSDKTYNRSINIFINGKEVENSLKSIEKEYYRLRNEVAGLVRGSAEYNQKVLELQRIKGILNDHKTTIAGTKGSWDKLKDGVTGFLTKVAGIAGVAYGAWKGIKSIIDSSESLSDKWNTVMGGAKEMFIEFKLALANVDFSNFIGGLTEAWKRGKELAEELDSLADFKAYQDYKIESLNRESRALQETIKDRTIDIKTREQAAADRVKIEEKIRDRTIQIAQRTFDIEKKTWEGRKKEIQITAEEAVKLYENVAEMDLDARTRMEERWDVFMLKWGKKRSAEKIREGLGYHFAGISEQQRNIFADFMLLTTTGEADILPKLFNMLKNIDEVKAYAQERFNTAKTEWSRINVQEGKASSGGDDEFNILDHYRLNKKSIAKDIKDLRKFVDEAYEELRPTWQDNVIKDAEFRAQVDLETNKKILAQREDLMKAEQEQTAKKLELYMDYATRVGAVLGQTVVDGEMTAKDAAKQLVLIAIDALRQYAKIAIAQSTMTALAQPDSVATFGATGLWRAAILTGLIEAALSGVEALIKKGLYTGGFTGWGGMYQPAGVVGGSVVHGQEWVANRNMVTSPVYGPMIQALEQVQRGGLASGGYSGSLPGQEAKGLTDPSLAPAINRLNRFLDSLERNGVHMNFGMREADGVRKGMNKLLGLESNVSL